MLPSFLKLAGAAAIAVATASCAASVGEVRSEGGNSFQAASTKSADVLSGCIAQAWIARTDATAVTTTKRPDGWIVLHGSGAWTYGVADVTAVGSGSTVSYKSNFARIAQNDHMPGIQRCL